MHQYIEYVIAFLIVLMIVLGLNGCSAIAVKSGAENIRILDKLPDFVLCTFSAEVVGKQGNWLVGFFTRNDALVTGARNDLVNQAFEVGANVVVVATVLHSSTPYSFGTSSSVFVGNAFLCDFDE